MAARSPRFVALLLPCAVLAVLVYLWMPVEEETSVSKAPAAAPVVEKSAAALEEDFSTTPTGALPQGWQAPIGTFGVIQENGVSMLEFQHNPMVEGRVLLPKILRGGGVIRAKFRGATLSKRAAPRFSVGLTQEPTLVQFRVAANQPPELAVGDQVKAMAVENPAKDLKKGDWIWLELSASASEQNGTLWEGRCWRDGASRPDKANISHQTPAAPGLRRASLHLAPFALKSIYVGQVEVSDVRR